jgi:DnaJ-class molecular chaperone
MKNEPDWEDLAAQYASILADGQKPCRICHGKGHFNAFYPDTDQEEICPECNGLGYDTGAHLVG